MIRILLALGLFVCGGCLTMRPLSALPRPHMPAGISHSQQAAHMGWPDAIQYTFYAAAALLSAASGSREIRKRIGK